MGDVRIVAFGASLREGSYSRAVVNAAIELSPKGAVVEFADVKDIPLFNQDLDTRMPAPAAEFKQKIRQADAVLFVIPEYNFSVPGYAKNAIDWASRPYGDSAFDGKPAAIMSCSPGMGGGSRAQYHLRHMLVFLNMFPLNQPEVMIPGIAEKIDANGTLVDEKTREKMRAQIEALVAWTRKLQGQK